MCFLVLAAAAGSHRVADTLYLSRSPSRLRARQPFSLLLRSSSFHRQSPAHKSRCQSFLLRVHHNPDFRVARPPPPHRVCVARYVPIRLSWSHQLPTTETVVLPDRLMIAQNAWALGAPDLFPPVALNWGKDGSLHCASGPSMFSPAACPSPLRSHGGTQTNKCREYHSLRRRVPGPDELVVKGPYEGKRERSFGLGRSVGSRRGQCRWCDAVMCGLAFSRRWFSVSIRSQLKNAEQFWPPQRQRAQNTEHQNNTQHHTREL